MSELESAKERAAKGILSHLDFLRPLLLDDYSLVRVALARFEFLQSKVSPPDPPLSLGTYEMSLEEARKFFPTTNPSFERLTLMMSTETRVLGPRVVLLDILTVLAILLRGSLEEKARYLFEWYNVSKTGVMTEVEHANLILRVANCLHRLKMIGILDITEDDAKHIALTSRVYRETAANKGTGINSFNDGFEEDKDNLVDDINSKRSKEDLSKIRFIPGLRFEDFYRWTRTSKEALVLVRFIQVLDRLTDALLVLDVRADSIMKILDHKQHHKVRACYVPRPDVLSDLKQLTSGPANPALTTVLYRGSSQVVLAVSTRGFMTRVEECYVKIEMLCRAPQPLYPVPVPVIHRNRNQGPPGHEELPLCCDRVYKKVSYQRCFLRYEKRNSLASQVVQVSVGDLDPASRYILTVYTREVICPPLEVSTQPGRNNLHLTVPPQVKVKRQAAGTVQRVSLGILPASLGLAESLNFVKDTPALNECQAVIFTSTLSGIAEQLQHLTLFVNTSEQIVDGLIHKFASAAGASADTALAANFVGHLSKLYGLTSGTSAHVEGFLAGHQSKQVLYYNGMGPWGSPDVKRQIKKHLYSAVSAGRLAQPLFSSVAHELENLYARYVRPLRLPVHAVELGPMEVLFIDGVSPRNAGFEVSAWVESRILREQDQQREQEQRSEEGKGEKPLDQTVTTDDGIHRVVVLLRSPLDLLLPMVQWTQRVAPSQPSPVLPAEADAGEDVNAEAALSEAETQASPSEQQGEGKDGESEEGVLVAMPVFGTVVDSPTGKQLEHARKGLAVAPQEQTSMKAGYGLNEEIAAEEEAAITASGSKTGGDVSDESLALREAYESNQWPHQSGKEAGHPDSDYYDSTGADQRPPLSSLSPLQREGGGRFYEKGTGGAAAALQQDKEEEEQIKMGIKQAGLRAIDANEKDEGMHAALLALTEWASDSASSAHQREVVLVSCAWTGGLNFEIVRQFPNGKKARIVHENLLPTRHYSSESGGDLDTRYRTDLDRDIETEEEEEVNLVVERMKASLPNDTSFTVLAASGLRAASFSSDITFPSLEDEKPTSVIADVGPGDGQMPVLATIVDEPSSEQREHNLQAVAGLSQVALSTDFLPLNRIVDKEIPAAANIDLPAVQVVDGPRLLRVESDHAVVGCVATGYGRVKCTLYELPFELNYAEAVSLVASERQTLRKVGSVTKRCVKRRGAVFRFKELESYANYCVCIDTWSVEAPDESAVSDVLPQVTQFRTLYHKHSKSCSMVVAGVDESDYALPSFGLSKVHELLNSRRPPAAPVHLVHVESRQDRSSIGPSKPSKADIQSLYRRAAVIHTLHDPGEGREERAVSGRMYVGHRGYTAVGDDIEIESFHADGLWQDLPDATLDYGRRVEGKTGAVANAGCAGGPASQSKFGGTWDDNEHDSAFSPINISWNGRFCRLAPRDGSVRCLVKMTDMIERLHMWLPEIDNLTLFVQKPLLRYLRVLKVPLVPRGEVEGDTATATATATASATATSTTEATTASQSTLLRAKSQRKEAQFKERWAWDYPNCRSGATDEAEFARVCAELFSVLIRWKAGAVGRDAQIVCIAEVKSVQVATIGFDLRQKQCMALDVGRDAAAASVEGLVESSVAFSIDNSSLGESAVADLTLLSGDDQAPGLGEGVELINVVGTRSPTAEPDAEIPSRPGTNRGVDEGEQRVVADNATAGVESSGDMAPLSPPPDAAYRADPGSTPKGSASVSRAASAEERDKDNLAAGGTATGDSFGGEERALVGGAEEGPDRAAEQGNEWPVGGEVEVRDEKEAVEGDNAEATEQQQATTVLPPPPGSPVHPPHSTDASRDQTDDHNSEEVQDDVSVLQYTHDEEMEKSYQVRNEYFHDLTGAEEKEEELVLPEERIRHIILPLYTMPGPMQEGERTGSWESSEDNTLFSTGLQRLHGYIEYEYDRNPDLDSLNIFVQPRREHLYGGSVNLREPGNNGEFEKAVYLCDVFVRPGEGACVLSESPDMHSVQGSQAYIPSPSSWYQEYTRRREFHHVLLRSYVAEVDLVEVVTGPVIGEVNQNSARIALELSQPMRQLSVICKPLGRCDGDGVPVNKQNEAIRTVTEIPDHYYLDCEPCEERVVIVKKVKPFKVFHMHFENLLPGQPYGVYIPELFGKERQGFFRTFKTFARRSDVLIMGQNALGGMPVVHNIIAQMKLHQIADIRNCVREMVDLFGCKIAALYSTEGEITRYHQVIGGSYPTIPWSFASEHIQRPCSEAVMTVHIGSLTFLSQFFDELVTKLLEHGRRAHFPLFEASCCGAYYLNQLEETIKDSFRLMWRIPAVQEQLRSGANVPVYLSDYLLSFDRVPDELKDVSKGATEQDVKLLAVIRKLYSDQLEAYMFPLYSHTAENTHHGRVYRTGPLAYIVLDVVTGRKKIKKKKQKKDEDRGEDVGEGNEKGEGGEGDKKLKGKKKKNKEEDAKFSLGFLDKEQWKMVKAVADDVLVTQIVIISQKPFIHLYEIPREYEEPEAIPKGEMLEWRPTAYDLRLFFTYFLNWILPKPGMPDMSKSLALVSTFRIPYVTQIQDLPTGTKMQQLVVGDLGVDKPYFDPHHNENDVESSLGGSIMDETVSDKHWQQGPIFPDGTTVPTAETRAGGEKIMAEPEETRKMREKQRLILTGKEPLKGDERHPQMQVGGTTVVDMSPRSPRPAPSANLEQDLSAVEQFYAKFEKDEEKQEMGSLSDRNNNPSLSQAAADAEQGGPEILDNDASGAVPVQETGKDDEEEQGQTDFGAPNMEDLTLTGKIGKFRYVHRFNELDHIHVDSRRESTIGGILDRKMNLQKLRRGVYATLSYTFDTWKTIGTWSIRDRSENMHLLADDEAILLVGPILGPPVLCEKTGPQEPDIMEMGVMIELDRPAAVKFAVRDALFGNTEYYLFHVDRLRPTICKITGLNVDSRYNVNIVEGVRKSHCEPFVITTSVAYSETNIAFINCQMPPEVVPQEDFARDLLRRFKVPFNGITATVHLNSNPDNLLECLDELKRLPILREGLSNALQAGALTESLYEVMANCMELIRDVYRKHLSRPAYRELLLRSSTLFMHTHDIFGNLELEAEGELENEDEDEDEASENKSNASEQAPPQDHVLRLLKLMTMRIHQEYFEQLNSMDKNVFRADKPPPEDEHEYAARMEAMTAEEEQRILDEEAAKGLIMDELSMYDWEEQVEMEVHKSNPRVHPVKMVFRQWLQDLLPSPPQWRNWISPSNRLIIEKAPSVLKKNLPQVLQMFKKPCAIDYGARLVVIDSNVDGSGVDKAFDPTVKAGAKYHQQAKKWLYPHPLYPKGKVGPNDEDGEPTMIPVIRDDRRVAFIAPSNKWGTADKLIMHVKEDDGPHAHIFTVDSLFRSNEIDRATKLLEVEHEAAAETKQQPKATTKKAKERQMEQEKLRREAKEKKLQDVFASFPADGFVIVESRCSVKHTTKRSGATVADINTSVSGHLVPSVPDMGKPEEEKYYNGKVDGFRISPYDNVYLPEWILRYFPAQDGVFAQDEVLLWMRQNEKTSRILKIIEGNAIVNKSIELYERSRLSELARPPDLREVQMDLPGVTEAFVKDLVEKIWADIVPEEVKPFLVPIDDDFMRAFLLSRALPNPEQQLANGESFAKGIQYALVLAVSMKISLNMQEDPRYKYIMESHDQAHTAANYLAEKDHQRWTFHERAKLEYGSDYDEDKMDAKYNEEAAAALEKEGYESDLDALEKEEAYLEQEGDRLDEIEEMKERMLDLEEKEAEDREVAAELLGEGEEDDEEEEEEEEEDPDNIVDDEEREEAIKRKAEREKEKEKEADRAKRPVSKEAIKRQNEARTTLLVIDSIPKAWDDAIEEAFGEAVDELVAEQIREEDKEAMLSKLPELTDVERTDRERTHQERLQAAKIKTRRSFGPRLLHLS